MPTVGPGTVPTNPPLHERPKTTFATDQAGFDARIREAWAAYHEVTTDLSGTAYDHAEAAAWEHLQDELADIERERLAPA